MRALGRPTCMRAHKPHAFGYERSVGCKLRKRANRTCAKANFFSLAVALRTLQACSVLRCERATLYVGARLSQPDAQSKFVRSSSLGGRQRSRARDKREFFAIECA